MTKEKLTSVTISANGRKIQLFTKCVISDNGKSILDKVTLDRCLRALGVTRGQAYSVG